MGFVQTSPGTFAAAVFHWNGTTWARTATLHAPAGVSATAVEATAVGAQSATDMWATGFYTGSGGSGNLAWHWDGTRWAVTTMPGGLPLGGLFGVAAINPTECLGGRVSPDRGREPLHPHPALGRHRLDPVLTPAAQPPPGTGQAAPARA